MFIHTYNAAIGDGAYWAGQATARPLFAPNEQAMMFALLKFLKTCILRLLVTLLILTYFVRQMSANVEFSPQQNP